MRFRFFNTYDTAAPFFRNLIPFLAASGHHVEVVTSKAEYRTGGNLSKTIGHLPGVKVKLTSNLGLHPNSRLTKIMVMIAYFVNTIVYTMFGPDIDRNVFLTQPPLIGLLGFLLSRIRGQPYYCVVMDIYPQLAVELGMMRREAILTRILGWLSASALRHAAGVIVIGRCMAERVEGLGIPAQRIHFIPNWADEQEIYPVAPRDNELRKKQEWQDKFVVLYAGNIGVPQHFDDILTIAKQMENREDILFVFIGSGSRQKEIEARVEMDNLTNIVMLPFLHDSYPLAQILSAGNIHLVPLKEVCTGLAVPSKSYSILAAGRPIIYQGRPDGEIAQMISEEEIGKVIRCGDIEKLREAILEYLEHTDLTSVQGNKARQLAENKYSRTRALADYVAIFERTVSNPGKAKDDQSVLPI